jgi:M3 family oligoendopeptidase
MSKFKYYPSRPKTLTADFVSREYKRLLKDLKVAEESSSADKWIKLYADWNALKAYVGGEGSRIYYRLSQDMSNKSSQAAEKYLREKIGPVCDEPEFTLTKAFLDSKHRDKLAEHYGQQLVQDYEIALKPLDPINTKLGIRAGQLTKKYEQRIASGTITVNGRKMTLSKARSLLESPDEKVREAAYRAGRDWFLKNRTYLANIYAQLVTLRNQMAKNIGFKNYTYLAYQNMGRSDYDQKVVKDFRVSVKKHLVPLYSELLQKQQNKLGKKSMKPWDEPYDPSTTLPMGIAPVDKQLDNVGRIFAALSPTLSGHFEQMRKDNLIDLENRRNKRAGAFCISFDDEGKAAILCNSVGSADDVRTLTHEMGHAFQTLESQDIEAVDLHWGTADLAEMYSMGMEFLSLKHMDEFFDSENVKKFSSGRWSEAVKLICYVCIVDEFQHWVYENIQATPAQRDKKWIELSDKYLPGIDFKGLQKYRKTRWYAQGHIFSAPFYYIDYALAELVAMQIGMIAEKSHSSAVKKYLDLCKLGGTKSFLNALEHADLRSPFDEKLIADIAKYAKRQAL